MADQSDPVERALQSLGGRSWPQAAHDPELERKLMESFVARNSTTFLARHRVLMSVAAVLVLATAAFAATGGVRMVMSWFATVSVDGQVVHTAEIVPNENGQATITLPAGSLPKNGEHEVSVTLEGNAPEGGGTTTVTVTGGSDEVTVQTKNTTEPGAQQEKK